MSSNHPLEAALATADLIHDRATLLAAIERMGRRSRATSPVGARSS